MVVEPAHLKKYDRQVRNLLQIFGVNIKKMFELPPPSKGVLNSLGKNLKLVVADRPVEHPIVHPGLPQRANVELTQVETNQLMKTTNQYITPKKK